jgi:hypothetical protein
MEHVMTRIRSIWICGGCRFTCHESDLSAVARHVVKAQVRVDE